MGEKKTDLKTAGTEATLGRWDEVEDKEPRGLKPEH